MATRNLNVLNLMSERAQEHRSFFRPYERQSDFVRTHLPAPVAYLSAGNGCGKTAIGAAMDVAHLTGEYPDWWEGYRFEECGVFWILSTAPKLLINGIQEQLMCAGGYYKIYQAWEDQTKPWPIDTHRGGKLPKRCILDIQKAPNVAKGNDYVESLTIRHASGGENQVWFGHYELGATKLAAKHNLLYIHWDEIPPLEMYSEGLSRQRTTASGVKQIITGTPERKADQRMIDMVFDDAWEESRNSRVIITIDDVPDNVISADNKAEAKAQTPERDKPAKLYGQPIGGSLFFEVSPDDFTITQSQWLSMRSERSWTAIGGLDFGFNDDTAISELHTDTAEGITVLVRSMKRQWMSPYEFGGACRAAGFNPLIRHSWPHDGLRRDKDMTTTKEGREAKKVVAKFYKEAGFKMLKHHTKRFLVEANKHAAFAEIENAAKQGRFFIVQGMNSAFAEEWRGLRIGEDGRVRGKDHVLDSAVCAWLNRQHGQIAHDTATQAPPPFKTGQAQNQNGVSVHLYH